MDTSPHTGGQVTVEAVNFCRPTGSAESKDPFITPKGHGYYFLGLPRRNPHRLSAEGQGDHGAMPQLNELRYELVSHPPYLQDTATSDLKKIAGRKKIYLKYRG